MAGTSADNSDDFYNKRAEMFWRQKEWLNTSLLEGNDWLDLLDLRYKIQSDKKIKIKSKEEMIKESIQSPDVADALSLTFYDLPFQSGGVKVFLPQWKGYNKK